MRKFLLLCLIACICVAPAAWSESDEQAVTATQSAAGERPARIGGGQTVQLAPSAKTAAQWAEMRPGFQSLKPKKR